MRNKIMFELNLSLHTIITLEVFYKRDRYLFISTTSRYNARGTYANKSSFSTSPPQKNQSYISHNC